MLKIQIKNRWTGLIIVEYEKENNTIRDTVLECIRLAKLEGKRANLTNADLTDANLTRADLTRADLTDANLTRADLTRADLTDANLTRANLTRANLTNADLTRANLTRANLTDANLTDANLTRANLTRANLTRADLTRANLTRANLTRADLTDANLTNADLITIKADFFMVLFYAVKEIPALKQHLIDGKINGSVYEGECSCLKGTIATARGCNYTQLAGIKPNTSAPAECWFMNIKIGDTPENNNVSKITLEWINEFERIVAGIKSDIS